MTIIDYKKKHKRFSKKELKAIYESMLRPRLIEEKMLNLLRLGKISKWFSGIGQEAIAVGCTMAMRSDEYIFPMHRNLGVFTTRNIPLSELFTQWEGKTSGFTKGRDRSFHFGTNKYNIVGMISHLGPQLSLAGGVALAHKLSREKRISLAFTGEGGTSEGEFHEALNVAAVWKLPVIFIVENNGYGLSTPTSQQYACKDIADRATGYGMKSEIIDGNNILEVYSTVDKIAKKIRQKPEPYLIECKTFRVRGHEEASGVKYVPKKLIEKWKKKDPVINFENYLIQEKVISEADKLKLYEKLKNEINQELENALISPNNLSDAKSELIDVYAPSDIILTHPKNKYRKMRMVDAIADAMQVAMKKYANLVLMGQDIADYGGVFKVTEGLLERFGSGRVRNTPICESAILGMALGLSIKGYKSMVEMQFSDFVTCGFTQIVNNLAKSYYRWGQSADVVVRMPTGGGIGAGPFHSQSVESWFTHVPGLKVVYPSSAIDAKGLLLSSFEDPNPVLFFEHKALYRREEMNVPEGFYTMELGKASLISEGKDMTILTYGMGVHWALAAKEEMELDLDILDLRTLLPLDHEAIDHSVQKTGRVIVLHEATGFGGFGGELAAYISENLFEYLDAPVMRCTSLDTPVPFNKDLEAQFMASARLKDMIKQVLDY